MKNIKQKLQLTDNPGKLSTIRLSNDLSQQLNTYFLITKFKKLHLQIEDLVIS